jgi:hypothetical protein
VTVGWSYGDNGTSKFTATIVGHKQKQSVVRFQGSWRRYIGSDSSTNLKCRGYYSLRFMSIFYDRLG